ncbi:hypothetical protein JYT20_00760, partial [Rhodothermus sp. AH-315-K08]|nr:hypothetical protein [Rhodothermus sp. AH-315-K08]
WLGTENGIVGFDTISHETLVIRADPEREDGLSTPTVFQVTVTEDGALWAATMLGVNLLRQIPAPGETARFERLTEETGLPNDVVYSIQSDGNGALWMSTNKGLAALDPETGGVRVFSPSEGLPGFEYNHGAFHTGPGGSLYFGGIDGITRVELDSRTFREFDAPIVVSTVEMFGETIASNLGDGAELRLRHDENYLTFSFSALDYLRPEASRFAFRLEPDDAGWTQAGTRRYQSYNNLDPGHYTFSVRGTNGDGVWSSGATSIEIYIVPPLWRRTWFLLLLSTLGLTAVGAAVSGWHRRGLKERDAKIMVQRQINDRLEAERVHLARELHDGPLQHLQLSGFQLTALDGRVEDEGLGSLKGVRDAVGEAMRELRSICGELRPPALVHFGLASAIRSHADRMVESYEDLSVELQLPTTGRMLSPRLRLGFFRMYQEAMNNIVRHARPCTATISLVVGEERVELVVCDDGPGFCVPSGWSKLAAGGHFGLLGAQERAAALNGVMDVSSISGKGTAVAFGAPTVFDEEATI